jgi:CheY-like chemotaxis protein/HPt (histidine-containing phosphotransfer) domain-containing protein
LVELMGGSIAVESQPGAGSTFRFGVTLKLAASGVVGALGMEAASGVVFASGVQAGSGVVCVSGVQVGLGVQVGSGVEPSLCILLAEDNPTNRLVALRILERLGHRPDAVGSGLEVIAALALTHYDLILMDVMLPDMDGLTATRQIRATEQPEARIAIVGLTAGSSKENLDACLEAGMDAVTTKPVTLARLRAAIAAGRAASVRPPVTDGGRASTPRLRELAETLGEEAVAEIVQAFTEDTQSHLATMRAAAARDDTNAIYRCAHSVAGAARNVGAEALAKRASALEETVGSLSATRIAMEIAAMQVDLDATLDAVAGRVGATV